MRSLIALATMVAIFHNVCVAHGDLYSKVAMESVFGKPSTIDSDEPNLDVAGVKGDSIDSQIVASLKAAPKLKAAVHPTFSVVGTWSAKLPGDESLAMRIRSDLHFQFVRVKKGESAVSTGKATHDDDQLTLAGDDKTTLRGRIRIASTDQFQWILLDAKGKIAAELSFSKAK